MSKSIKIKKSFLVLLVITCIFFICLSIKLGFSRRIIIESNNSAMFILFIHELEDVIKSYNVNDDGVFVTEYDNDLRDISALLTRFELFEEHSEYVYNLYSKYSNSLSDEKYQELLELKVNLEYVYDEYKSEIYGILPRSHKESKSKFMELVEKYE